MTPTLIASHRSRAELIRGPIRVVKAGQRKELWFAPPNHSNSSGFLTLDRDRDRDLDLNLRRSWPGLRSRLGSRLRGVGVGMGFRFRCRHFVQLYGDYSN